MIDEIYTFDEIYHVRVLEGLPQTKTVLKQVEYTVASTRALGGKLLKLVHDETLGPSQARLRAEIRRLLRVMQREGRIRLMIPGEQFSMSDTATRYLADKCPQVELDLDMDKKNGNITVVQL